jgi:hypothetical protein
MPVSTSHIVIAIPKDPHRTTLTKQATIPAKLDLEAPRGMIMINPRLVSLATLTPPLSPASTGTHIEERLR